MIVRDVMSRTVGAERDKCHSSSPPAGRAGVPSVTAVLNGDQGFPSSFSQGPHGFSQGPPGPTPVMGSGPARTRHPGRRWFLIGAAATALGGGGVAAVLMNRHEEPLPRSLVLATGPKGAVYVEVGADIAHAVNYYSPRTMIEVRQTAATVENLHLLASGKADVGFASLDAAGDDVQVRNGVVTGLCRVYDSYLHLVVPAESPIMSLRDLGGKRVAIGGAGSGTEFTANTLLSVAGVKQPHTVNLGQTPSMQALSAGSIEAAFSLTGIPTPAIRDLASRRPLRLIELSEYFGDLDRTIPRAYAPAPIPSGTYHQVDAAETVLVPNALLARPGLSDVTVTLFMNALFSEQSQRFWVSADSKRISRDMATVVGAATLHPAAKAWLDSHG